MAKAKNSKKKTTTASVSKSSVAVAVAAAAPVVAPAPVAAAAVVTAPVADKKVSSTFAPSTRTLPVSRDAVAKRAFDLFLARGGQHGHAMRDWLQAEAELGLGRQ